MAKILFAFGITFCLLHTGSRSCAQFNENVWCFGDSAGIDFNSTVVQPIKSNVKTRGACTSICDRQGNLLFYASNFNYDLWIQGYNRLGVIYNSSNQIVEGGDSIVATGWYNELLLLPNPADSNLIYLFHMGVTGSTNPGFYYSVINRSENSGGGKVIQKNVQLDNVQNCDGMHAVRHANGRDWWLVTKKWATFNNRFYIYLVSPSGVSLHHTQDIGSVVFSSFFKVKFAPSGDKMVGVSNQGLIELYDFDRCTGDFTGYTTIDSNRASVPVPYYWGVEFSPNSEILYVSTLGTNSGASIDTFSTIQQFNLMVPNVFLSKNIIDTVELPYKAGMLELGVDDKIYFTSRFDDPRFIDEFYLDTVNLHKVKHLGVIHQPNNLGLACDYRPISFYLGGERTYYGLPNNPNYRAGAIPGTVCDSLGLGISQLYDSPTISVYPNPAEDFVTFDISETLSKCSFFLYSSTGQLVIYEQHKASQFTVVRNHLPSGLYFYRISDGKESYSGKIVFE